MEEKREREKEGALLIVDDDELNRAVLRNIFEPDYPIWEAGDGLQGLEAVLEIPLGDGESRALEDSARQMKQAIASLKL